MGIYTRWLVAGIYAPAMLICCHIERVRVEFRKNIDEYRAECTPTSSYNVFLCMNVCYCNKIYFPSNHAFFEENLYVYRIQNFPYKFIVYVTCIYTYIVKKTLHLYTHSLARYVVHNVCSEMKGLRKIYQMSSFFIIWFPRIVGELEEVDQPHLKIVKRRRTKNCEKWKVKNLKKIYIILTNKITESNSNLGKINNKKIYMKWKFPQFNFINLHSHTQSLQFFNHSNFKYINYINV